MPTTTRGYRYPASTQPLAETHTRINELAADVDTKVGRIERGTATVAVSASSQGTLDVNFATAFTAAPTVVATSENPSYAAFARFRTVNDVEIGVRHLDGTSATVNVAVSWVAVG